MLETSNKGRLWVQIDPIFTRQHLLGRNLGFGQRSSDDVRSPASLRLLAFLGLESFNELLDLLAGTLPKHINRETLCFRFPDRCGPTAVVGFGRQKHVRLFWRVHHIDGRVKAGYRFLEIRFRHTEDVYRGDPGPFRLWLRYQFTQRLWQGGDIVSAAPRYLGTA
jgi:hypothetical protein